MARIEFTIVTADPGTADTLAHITASELFGCNRSREGNQFVADPSHVHVIEIGDGERHNSTLGDGDGGQWHFRVVAEYGPPF